MRQITFWHNCSTTLVMALLCSFHLLTGCALFSPAAPAPPISWEEQWQPEIFTQAQQQNKYVLLNLEARWCHWCHVMAQKTYMDEDVMAYIKKHFIPVRVDQDSRPDLANRYRKYGWPATIIFDSKGEEIIKKRGYIEAGEMEDILADVVENPGNVDVHRSPSPNYSKHTSLPSSLQVKLFERYIDSYDPEQGGYRLEKKFVDPDMIEYGLYRAFGGELQSERMVRHTLDQGRLLIDPHWGGMYQYSTHSDWFHPHYEKIMSTQAGSMRVYAIAARVLDEPKYLRMATDIERYLRLYLRSQEGAFYASQDADLVKGKKADEFFTATAEEREKMGMPAIDKNIYSRENGWAAEALAYLYQTTAKKRYLKRAIQAVEWIEQNRRIAKGGFAHGEDDQGGPFLGDTLAMLGAYLALYKTTANPDWLSKAQQSANFIAENFQAEQAGYYTVAKTPKQVLRPVRSIDENIRVARFMNLLFHLTLVSVYQERATWAMQYLATPKVALRRISEPGILLADFEMNFPPLHVSVVGEKDNQQAKELFVTALQHASIYKIVEWAPVSASLPSWQGIAFPQLGKPAAFICHEQACSAPTFTSKELKELLESHRNK